LLVDRALIDRDTRRIAQAVLGNAPLAGDPVRTLREKLVRLRGPGAGFSKVAASIAMASRHVSGVAIGDMAFEESGTVSLALRGMPSDRERFAKVVAGAEMRLEVLPGADRDSALVRFVAR
jgi:general secretion pathway protein L